MLGSTYHINSRAHVLLEEHRNTAKTTWGYKLGHSCALFEKKSTTVLRAWKGKATHIERNWKWATPTDKFTMEAEKRILINRKGKLSMANTATAENVQSQNQNECVIPRGLESKAGQNLGVVILLQEHRVLWVVLLLQSGMAFYSYLFTALCASHAICTAYLEEYTVLINSGHRYQAQQTLSVICSGFSWNTCWLGF